MLVRFIPQVLTVALIAVVGCGDDGHSTDSGSSDSAVDGGADGASLVAPPEIPWLADGVPPIMLAPCPEGWREVTGGDVTECDPYPEAGPEACTAGEAHFPGEAGCRPVGDPCPAGDYATSLPSDGPIVYVKAGAPRGGDGTVAAPYAELYDVNWAGLAPGTTVALAKGTYDGTLSLHVGVHVVGACAEQTVLTGIDDELVGSAVVIVRGGGAPASVHNVTLRGAPKRGVQVQDGRDFTLAAAVIERAQEVGLVATGAGTVVAVDNVVIRDTRPRPDDGFVGNGVQLVDGARLEGSQLLLSGSRGAGVVVIGPGTTMVLEDAVVRDTESRAADDTGGSGCYMRNGGRFDAARLLVTGNRNAGMDIGDEGTTVNLVDTIVRDTQSQESDGLFGRGFNVARGAHLSAARLLVSTNRQFGIFAESEGTAVTLTDTVIRGTRVEEASGLFGRGLGVQRGAHVEATALLIAGNHEVGVYAVDDLTKLSLTDTAIRDTLPAALDDRGGFGVQLSLRAHLEGSRVFVSGNREIGLLAGGVGTEALLSDVVIQDMLPRANDDRFGRGLQFQDQARLQGVRVRIVRVIEVGIIAVDGAVADLGDVSVVGVERSSCTSATCPPILVGHGVATVSADIYLRRFEIRDAANCGVFLTPNASSSAPTALDLEEGVVAGSLIGACVQVDEYDLGRLTNGVAYQGNGTNLDSTTMPVPDVIDVIDP